MRLWSIPPQQLNMSKNIPMNCAAAHVIASDVGAFIIISEGSARQAYAVLKRSQARV
jgi:hypothetical protein